MIVIPPEMQFDLLLKPGKVYLFKSDNHSSQKKHFFVVLNSNPKTDEILILCCASTIVAEDVARKWVQEGLKNGTIIQGMPEDADFIDRPTKFNCSSLEIRNKVDLIGMLTEGKLTQEGTVQDGLLKKLKDGVMKSELVEAWKKDLVR